jgi:RHS repeat-associated protein
MSFLRRQESRSTGYGKLIRRWTTRTKPYRSRYGLFTRGVSVLMAYLFIISPPLVQNLAEAATQYSRLTRDQWATVGTVITYEYDDNGTMTLKTETGKPQIGYSYNLQGRLETKYDTIDDTILVQYVYNDAGIRVQKIEDPDGTPVITNYLVDSANHTGYAQVLEEITDDGTDITLTTYTLGDDVIGQAKATWNTNQWVSDGNPKFLLYDGHGSVRQHAASDGTLAIYTHDPGGPDEYDYNAFSYDAYGHAITPLPEKDGLYYTGEMFDGDADQYYLRARYYDPSNGRFNRLDPYAGNMQDPQSLHKYLYCHNNPINGVDPTGMFTSVAELNISVIIGVALIATLAVGINKDFQRAVTQSAEALIRMIVSTFSAIGSSIQNLWNNLVNRLSRFLDYIKKRGLPYLHYSFKMYAASLVSTGLWPVSWATRDIYPTGKMAEERLSLPRSVKHRDAVYIVWPQIGFSPTGPTKALPLHGHMGGGNEYFFAKGSGGPGTVFGPIPITPVL